MDKKSPLKSKTNQYAFGSIALLLVLPGGRELVCQNLEVFFGLNTAAILLARNLKSNIALKKPSN